MSHDRGCFKCGEDVDKRPCDRPDCPRLWPDSDLNKSSEQIGRILGTARVVLRVDHAALSDKTMSQRRDAYVKGPDGKWRLGLVDGVIANNDEIQVLVYVYHLADIHLERPRRRLLNSKSWTRQYWPLKDIQILWEDKSFRTSGTRPGKKNP